ncbi:GNAT family N-acetyltransferase [Calothrix sp. NIES-3974]|uniref:GNAT family N-acetyltransferase n=1 Tax=Calothrix sp. NIES-3974 TaxID=2005462 RepID=UPI000B612781|nr:GNAT family N-acetyltransferase [Calothrix sp. NIES-3974]BAZ05771.1 GCN5-related N-acetyltransferase [Calothrix sp. NIES-3974]
MVLIRPATASEIWTIRKLVLSAKLDMTQLRSQQFLVIEFDGRIIGCGQLREFPDAQELGSLVVVKKYRQQGLATLLIQKLLEIATKPVYLECLGQKLADFYTHRGFVEVDYHHLPSSLQAKYRLSHITKNIIHLPVMFMYYENNS